MNTLRKISLVLALTLIFNTSLPVLAGRICVDDFKNYYDTSGTAAPAGWTSSGAASPAAGGDHQISASADENGNRFVSLYGKAGRTGGLAYSKSVPGITGTDWGVSFKFKTTNNNCDESIFTYTTESGYSNFYIKGDGKFSGLGDNTGTQNNLVAATGGTRTAVKNDQWQTITILSYQYNDGGGEAQRLSLYVDGVFGGYRKASDLGVGGALNSVSIMLSAGSSAKNIDISSGFDAIYAFNLEEFYLTGEEVFDGSEDIEVGKNLKLNFTNPVHPDSLSKIKLQDSQNNLLSINTSYSSDMNTIEIAPVIPLSSGADYVITLENGFSDAAGNQLTEVIIHFSTAEFTGIIVSRPNISMTGGGVHVDFTVSNKTPDPLSAFACAGIYSGDELIDIAVQKISLLASGNDIPVPLDVLTKSGIHDYTVKVFVLDFALAPVCSLSPDTVNTRPTLYVAGDSIAAYSSNYPKSGWAQHLNKFFNDDITFVNKAIGGQSSRTYYSVVHEPYGVTPWQELLSNTKPGDYVAIQFGHNDTNSAADKDTNPLLGIDVEPDPLAKTYSYKWYLSKFISEAKALGVNPILVSSIGTRSPSGAYNPRPFQNYADAMVEVGQLLDVPVLNLNKETVALYVEYGNINNKIFFNILEEGAFPNWPNGYSDQSHLRDYGGIYVACLFRSELLKTSSTLKDYALNEYPHPLSLFLKDRFREDIVLLENNGQIFVPVIPVFQGLDAENIAYDQGSGQFSALFREKEIAACVGSSAYTVGGNVITAGYAPELINGEIYVPAIFFQEICGGSVYINDFMKMATILTGVDSSSKPFFEGFDGFAGSSEENKLPSGWSSSGFSAGKSYAIGGETDGSTGEAVQIVRSGASGSAYMLYKTFEYSYSKDIEMRIKLTNLHSSSKDIRLQVNGGGLLQASTYIIGARIQSEYIYGPNGVTTNRQTIEDSNWYTLKFRISIVVEEGDVKSTVIKSYVDGVFLGEYNVPYSTGMLQGLRFEVSGADTGMYIDDINITNMED